MEDNLSVRFLVRKVIEPIRLVILAQNRLIGILEHVRKLKYYNIIANQTRLILENYYFESMKLYNFRLAGFIVHLPDSGVRNICHI